MASIIDTIRLTGTLEGTEWTEAVEQARDRLRLDPRIDPEQMRDVEFVGGSEGYALYRVCCGTKGGDVLTVSIFHGRS